MDLTGKGTPQNDIIWVKHIWAPRRLIEELRQYEFH